MVTRTTLGSGPIDTTRGAATGPIWTFAIKGTALTVSFVGAPLPGNQPCGEDYFAEAVESNLAVTVIVTRHPFLGPVVACPAVGATRTATATLAAPLGDRTVLDLQGGQPVTLTLTLTR